MSRQYNSNGRDQFNVEKNHGNIFYEGFHALAEFAVFAKQIFLFFAPPLLQSSHDLAQVEKEYVIKQEDLKIQRDRLDHEINSSGILIELEKKKLELQKREYQLTCNYLSIRLHLIREYQAERISLKLQELQVNWDVHNSPLLVSKQELFQFFNQPGYELSILLAPPKIISNLEEFNSLEKELEYKLEKTIEKYYSFASEKAYDIVKYRQLFKRSIKKLEASRVCELLKPFPTLIINSEITDREVYVTVTYSGCTNSNNQNVENQFDLPPWDWEEIKEALDLQGKYSKDNIRCVRTLIEDFHIVIALCLSDFYCLKLDPYHKPKLLSFIENREFPEPLQKTIESYRNYLIEYQTSIQDSIRSQIPQLVRDNNTYSYSNNRPEALGCGTILVLGIGMMLLFGFCSQKLPPLDTYNRSESKNSIENYEGKSGIIQVNRHDKNSVNMRSAPNGKVIGIVQNGTHVTLEELSSDHRWQKVKTKDGKSGWVWAEFVTFAS